jgi:hypothetical protein
MNIHSIPFGTLGHGAIFNAQCMSVEVSRRDHLLNCGIGEGASAVKQLVYSWLRTVYDCGRVYLLLWWLHRPSIHSSDDPGLNLIRLTHPAFV